MKKIMLFLACGLFVTTVALAQAPKLAYLNSLELLQAMPDRAKADTNLAAYAKTFQDQLEAMQKEYQSKVQQYQTQEKTMTDAMKEVKVKEIQDLQNRMESTQQSAQDKVQQKKQELYAPVLERADKAIKEVAKEKGYDYVFDASQAGLLYAKDGDNIIAQVKAKLGLK
jgi:outer membrane protein